MMMLSRKYRLAAVAIAAMLTAGCGSELDGAAQPAEIDVRTLDVGKYSTDPLEVRYTYAPDLSNRTQLSMMRLAGNIAVGPEIDPRFTYSATPIPVPYAHTASRVLTPDAAAALDRNGLLFGYAARVSDKSFEKSGNPSTGSTFIDLTVMQFPDEETAARSAAETDAIDFAVAADANQPVILSKYPGAHSHWRPGIATIGSTLAHGKYVVHLFIGVAEPQLDQLTALAEQVYAVQLPLLDTLPPLSREDMLRLPYDPDGMLRRTLNPNGLGAPNVTSQAVFGLRGFLHQSTDQGYWNRTMNDAGVDRYSISDYTRLFRARDDGSARKLADVALELSFPGAAAVPGGVPGSSCGEKTNSAGYSVKRFRCVLVYRQYVATVESDQLADAHQQAAAQYALLANSTW